MPKVKGALRNPFPHGEATFSCRENRKNLSSRYHGYDYRNNLLTVHPTYRWCKYVVFVVKAEQRGLKPTRGLYEYYRTGYHNPSVNVNMWTSIANAGYIKYNPHKHCYEATHTGKDFVNFLENNFGPTRWNSDR